MANYPSYAIDADTYKAPLSDGSSSSRADSGALRIQRLWPSPRATITFEHPDMSWQDYLDLLQFYTDNLTNSEIIFTDPKSSQVYLVSMPKMPEHTEMFGSVYYRVSVELEGVMSGGA